VALTASYTELWRVKNKEANGLLSVGVRLFKAWEKHGLAAPGSDFARACGRSHMPSFVAELLALWVHEQRQAQRLGDDQLLGPLPLGGQEGGGGGSAAAAAGAPAPLPLGGTHPPLRMLLDMLAVAAHFFSESCGEPLMVCGRDRGYLYDADEAGRCRAKWGEDHGRSRPYIIHLVDPSYNVRRGTKFGQWNLLAREAGVLRAQLLGESWAWCAQHSTLAPAVRHFALLAGGGGGGGPAAAR